MGYTTDFEGSFKLDAKLTFEQAAYLRKFSDVRHMDRNVELTAEIADPVRHAVNLPIGDGAAYFVGEGGFSGQDRDRSIMDYNNPPSGQPGLWCQWEPTPDDDGVEWNGAEKFYNYVEWLRYIIEHFLKPWGRTLSGEVTWQGEDSSDIGKIVVNNNVVETRRGRVVYE